MSLTQAEALTIVSLDSMRTELRIPPVDPLRPTEGTEHDGLITSQIHSAASFVMESTGAALADLPPLRPAIVSLCRELYDGYRELSPTATAFAWLQPYRSYAAPDEE